MALAYGYLEESEAVVVALVVIGPPPGTPLRALPTEDVSMTVVLLELVSARV